MALEQFIKEQGYNPQAIDAKERAEFEKMYAETTKYDPTKMGQTTLQEIGTPPAKPIDTGPLKAEISGQLSTYQQLTKERGKIPKPGLQDYQEALSTFGFTPESMQKQQQLQGQLVEYQRQIQEMEAQKQQALIGLEMGRGGALTSIVRGEQALLERQYNGRIANIAAQGSLVTMQYEMERGLMEDAMKMANIYMEYAMFEYTQKLDDLNWIRDIYKDMSDEDYRTWQKSFQEAEFEWSKKYQTEQLNLSKQGLALGWARENRLAKEAGVKIDEGFIEDMISIGTFESRKDALDSLEKNKTALLKKYGEEQYQELLNEVDRLYPEEIPLPKKTPEQRQADLRLTGQAFRYVPSVIYETVKGGYQTNIQQASAFFSGLFGL